MAGAIRKHLSAFIRGVADANDVLFLSAGVDNRGLSSGWRRARHAGPVSLPWPWPTHACASHRTVSLSLGWPCTGLRGGVACVSHHGAAGRGGRSGLAGQGSGRPCSTAYSRRGADGSRGSRRAPRLARAWGQGSAEKACAGSYRSVARSALAFGLFRAARGAHLEPKSSGAFPLFLE